DIQMPSKNDDEEFQKIIGTLRSYLDKIAEHGQRATDIIQGILLYSRGKEDEYMKTDIQRLLKEYVWLSYHAMRANLKDFNVTIHESYDSSIPEMNIIPQDFSRAILNLMNNSCYAVWKKQLTAGEEYVPTVKVEAILADNQLKISIEDNGIGMSEEVRQHIFTAFFTTKPAGEGTGLGLSITQNIIKKHQGHIEVVSEENKFTRFTIIIPVH
ncbi:HAMP domain-containing sensor histidine kinase, partial [uncultured Parabacteroides sp.]|uniref:sensor histidine kinase n=1 Tax=uncultured Parabacteroides sp. TaxID=512312 RepID=UPI002595DE40